MPVLHTGNFGGKPESFERIISGLNYLTLGLSGLIYTIIQGRYSRTNFFRFHFLQAILLGIFGMLIGWTSNIFVSIVGGILQLIPGAGPEMINVLPLAIDWILRLGTLLLVYGLIMALMGKEAELPIVSKIVRQQLR